MFSVIFPGQGSQIVGMGKDFYDKYSLVQDLFKEADETLGYSLSNIILNGPKEDLDLTENTQPAIFLISYSIFKVIKEEFNINLNKANFFAGHSLGEYSALAASRALSFSDTLKILKIRGKAMQSSVPKGVGGMVAVLGSEIEKIENLINDNKTKYECYIANDNSVGQIVLSGNIKDLEKIMVDLKSANIKNIKLPVSAPFHCKLMNKATLVMNEELSKLNFNEPENVLISNVTGKEITSSSELKNLLVQQIESRVRWRESVLFMIDKGINHFIEIGPGKVLSGLVKRIDRNVKVSAINTEEDIKLIDINEQFKK
jgi:[acyl-carrier-protein] S-malonyltransferase